MRVGSIPLDADILWTMGSYTFIRHDTNTFELLGPVGSEVWYKYGLVVWANPNYHLLSRDVLLRVIWTTRSLGTDE